MPTSTLLRNFVVHRQSHLNAAGISDTIYRQFIKQRWQKFLFSHNETENGENWRRLGHLKQDFCVIKMTLPINFHSALRI